jgi:hypothetical protein
VLELLELVVFTASMAALVAGGADVGAWAS